MMGQDIFLLICVSSSIPLIHDLAFLVQRYFTSFVKYLSKYFIVFDAVVNGIIFCNSLSDNVLLVYITTTDFCMVILFPATLLN